MMGCYDTFIDGEEAVQCKAFNDTDLRTFGIGEEVPEAIGQNMTVALPSYEPIRFIVIKKGKFVRLTNLLKKTLPPYVSKWGDYLSREDVKAGNVGGLNF